MRGLILTIQGPGDERMVEPIPAGDAGTDATIAAMVGVARASVVLPAVRRLAGTLAREADPRIALFRWIRSHVRFERDPKGTEFIRNPARVIQAAERARPQRLKALADCDDVATMAAAVLLVLGYRPVFIVIGRDADEGFEHVFFGTLEGDKVYPMDPQEVAQPGRELPAVRRRVYSVR